LEDVYEYPTEKPEWFKELKREKNRAYRAKKLGRSIGSWGGKRKGAGAPRQKDYNHTVNLELNGIQVAALLEMGSGNLRKGIETLINRYM
jgi:hypothetical protein